jgi:hypothetical protein
MSLSWEVGEHFLILTVVGEVDNADFLQVFGELSQSGVLEPGAPLLVVDEEAAFDADHQEVKEAAQILADFSELLGRIAVVVATDLQFGVGRMIASYAASSGVEIQLFKDRAEAEEWLRSV